MAVSDPFFDIAGWVLSLAGLSPGLRVLDAGCGNGEYLRALAGHAVHAAGCDLSMGMLRSAGHRSLLNADIAALPFRDGTFDVVLAVHMLYWAWQTRRPTWTSRSRSRTAARARSLRRGWHHRGK